MAVWHPDATRVPYLDVGPFTVGRPKLVWHTTETLGLPRYSGSAPHFTFDPLNGKLWQHIAVNRAALSLMHPAGTVETNKAHAIQVELLGYSDAAMAQRIGHPERAVIHWDDGDYNRIATLARWIEHNAGVPRQCGVSFVPYPSASYPRLSPNVWLGYSGHLGHQHVPNNLHGDPSTLDIHRVLGNGATPATDHSYPGSPLLVGSAGAPVRTVQGWLNTIRNPAAQAKLTVDGAFGPLTRKRVRQFQTVHKLEVDGIVGRKTWAALRTAVKNHKKQEGPHAA